MKKTKTTTFYQKYCDSVAEMEMNDVDAGSQDLFSSQDMSQGTNINEQIDITLQVISSNN